MRRRSTVLAVAAALAAVDCARGFLPDSGVRAPTTTAGSMATGPAAAERSLSDAEIARAALVHMRRDPALAGTVVRVQSTNGIVELTGTTKNLLAKRRAVRHVEALRGVRSVSNRLAVERATIPDAIVAEQVKGALVRELAGSAREIHVEVRDGVVSLSGESPSIAAKHLAVAVAEGVRGATEVQDDIDVVITAKRHDADIEREVRACLKSHVFVDDALVRASASNGTVRLAGIVGSATEKARATEVAWVAGVTRVDATALRVDPAASRDALRGDKYADRGPEEIRAAIVIALARDPRVRLNDVTLSVSDRTVTLRGAVASVKAKRAAEQIAHDTVGVVAVVNLLEVRPAFGPRDAADVERDVNLALALDPYTGDRDVDARIEGGTAILSGTVDSVFEKAEAESAAAGVAGVRDIDNRISVRNPSVRFVSSPFLAHFGRSAAIALVPPEKTSKSDAEIASDLVLELGWSPFLDVRSVETSVRDGRVLLTGSVASWQAWYAAYHAAFDAGAIAVDNRLVVRGSP